MSSFRYVVPIALLLIFSWSTTGCADDAPADDAGWGLNPDAGREDTSDADLRDADQGFELTPTEFRARWRARDMCGFMAWCHGYYENVGRFFEMLCHPKATEVFGSDEDAAALAGPRVEFDAAAAERCLTSIEQASSCAELDTARPSCQEVISGGQAEDESCIADVECASGLYCKKNDTCPGTCTPKLSIGTYCERRGECGDGLFCAIFGNRTCEPSNRAQGEACNNLQNCGPGLTCCMSNELCSNERFQTCVPEIGEGERCAEGDSSFSDVGCEIGLNCIAGICQKGSVPGEACSNDVACVVGSHCVRGTCHELSMPGASCAADENCPGSYFCDDGTCEPLPVIGESCEDAQVCFEGACVDGVCEFLENGAECVPRALVRRCESGFCDSNAAGRSDVGLCAPPYERAGASCLNEYECARGQVCSKRTCTAACIEI